MHLSNDKFRDLWRSCHILFYVGQPYSVVCNDRVTRCCVDLHGLDSYTILLPCSPTFLFVTTTIEDSMLSNRIALLFHLYSLASQPKMLFVVWQPLSASDAPGPMIGLAKGKQRSSSSWKQIWGCNHCYANTIRKRGYIKTTFLYNLGYDCL